MHTQNRKIRIKPILKNPLAEKLEIKHKNYYYSNASKIKKTIKSY